MTLDQLEAFAWPASESGRCLAALAQAAKLIPASVEVNAPYCAGAEPFSHWVDRAAKHLGFEVEQCELTLGELENKLCGQSPAIVRVSDSCYLAVLRGNRRKLLVLAPSLAIRRISTVAVCRAIRKPAECATGPELERLLETAGIDSRRRTRALDLLLREHAGDKRFDQCWTLRLSPSARPITWFKQIKAVRNGMALLIFHTIQYLLWLVSWVILGRVSLNARMDQRWLLVWAMMVAALIPFRGLTTWLQGQLAISLGGLLKRRLLYGAMRLDPEELRKSGLGSFLGQALEAETLETLALNGAVVASLAVLELVISGLVLGPLAPLLILWSGVALFLGWRFLQKYHLWTGTRVEMTHDLIEAMIGHRTRLAQLPREAWHNSEDETLASYLAKSRDLDYTAAQLSGVIPRGWLIAGLACLAPTIATAQASPGRVAALLGGILLAFAAFKRLTSSSADIAGACVAWRRLRPLFRAAARPHDLGAACTADRDHSVENLIDADRLTYRYRPQASAALQNCTVSIKKGDRLLLEGPSGGGKTTFASLLCGLRRPESGLLLLNGLDLHTLGPNQWRESVAAAPQFNENYILTETLAFNLLMGRRWPPTESDMQDAESLCRRLGLGKLLDTMPSGMLQMVGEGGWQLSHGERSRIYIARALLGRAELVILDESFAALDPENLRVALECALERAPTLMVIAHP